MRTPDELYTPSLGLEFDEAEHVYTLDGWVLTSVTTVIKKYSVPFEADAQAARIAERDGTTAEAILAKWDANNAKASERGTYIHNHIEGICRRFNDDWGIAAKLVNHPEEYVHALRAAWRWFSDHSEIQQGYLAPEFRVVHPGYGLAGTIDLIASTYEGVPAIIDWKTNKTLSVDGYSNMLPPFQRGKLALPDSNLFHYYLQLNMYRRILMDRYDFNDATLMVLVHLEDNGRYTTYNVPAMDAHVDRILEGLAT